MFCRCNFSLLWRCNRQIQLTVCLHYLSHPSRFAGAARHDDVLLFVAETPAYWQQQWVRLLLPDRVMKLLPLSLPPVAAMDRLPLSLPFSPTDLLWRYPLGFPAAPSQPSPVSPLLDFKTHLPTSLGGSFPQVLWKRRELLVYRFVGLKNERHIRCFTNVIA
jgi:hypothetical protein